MYTVYVTFVYKYVSILQYFSVLSFLLHMSILCLSSFSKNYLLSFFLESRVLLCMYTLYFERCTLYKFIEINDVLFCKNKGWGKLDYTKVICLDQWTVLWSMDEPNTKRSWNLTLCRKHESNVYCCGIIEIVSPVEQNNISSLARAYLTHKHIINLHLCVRI